MVLEIKINADAVARQLSSIQSLLNKAIADTLTEGARDLQKLWKADIKTFLHRPSSFTQRVFSIRARKDNLVAVTFLPDIQSEYLSLSIGGGLRRVGDVQSLANDLLIPVDKRRATTNIAGNFPTGPRKWLATVESRFKGAYIGPPGADGRGAVYQRQKSGLKLLAVFEQTVEYDKILDLERTAELSVKNVDDIMQKNFDLLLK